MTAEEFVKTIESYYGKYSSPLVRSEVVRYIKDFHAAFLDVLYDEITLRYSTRYKVPPDKATIAEARPMASERYRPPKKKEIEDKTQDYRQIVGDMLSELVKKLRVGGG